LLLSAADGFLHTQLAATGERVFVVLSNELLQHVFPGERKKRATGGWLRHRFCCGRI